MSDFKVKFLGTRGSYPVFGDKYKKFGGSTTCVTVEIDGKVIIFDSGTGIIEYGKELAAAGVQKEIFLFITHTHQDHIQGMPFFAPLYSHKFTVNIAAPKMFEKSIGNVLSEFMDYQYFPVKFEQLGSKRNIIDLKEDEYIEIKKDNSFEKFQMENGREKKSDEIVVYSKYLKNHPVGGVYIYKVEYQGKSMVFATDVEGFITGDSSVEQFCRNADILIYDSAYTKEEYKKKTGWGHSTPEMAAVVAKNSNVKQLYLTHHDPNHDDEMVERKLTEAEEVFKNSVLAYDGLEITV